MSSLIKLLLLTLLQFVAGFGFSGFFKLQLKPALVFSLSLLLGIAVFSIVPFVLQLFYVPLTSANILISLIAACIALNIQIPQRVALLKLTLQNVAFKIKIYEVPFFIIIVVIVFVSVWRCFYFPPTPRDLTSGAEVIAEYAVKEKTMMNSVFTVDLSTTNNQFKSPFISSLQIIYKYAGFPFGQIWLSTIFISFIIFLHEAICIRVHKIIAGWLIIFFIAIPEMYAYTFMALFDYSNAVFFFLSAYFLFEFFRNKQTNHLFFSGLLMGIATYIRSETLVLACFMAFALLWFYVSKWSSLTKIIKAGFTFLLPSIFIYLLSVSVYINFYLPVKYNVGELVNTHLLNVSVFFNRFIKMNSKLIFSDAGINYYGYFIFIFLMFLVSDLALYERRKSETRNWLYAILVIYFGLPFLSYLLPLMDIDNSVKRGIFKIFPLMLLYISSSGPLIELSQKLTKWETAI